MRLFNKSNLLILVLIISATIAHVKAKTKTLCESETTAKTSAIANHPLFDTPYKAAANYLPVLALRALGSTEIYRKKGHARIVRNYYVRSLQGKLGEPYETMTLNIEVKAKGLFGRVAIGTGTINDLDLYYENHASFGLPRRVYMDSFASLDGCEFLKLKVVTDGDKLINDVTGTYLSKTTNYKTEWRNTNGMLAGYNYQITAEGNSANAMLCDKSNQDSAYCKEHSKGKEGSLYEAKSSGLIAGYKITGWIKETRPNHFESEENYGPILVKTTLDTSVGL